MAKDLEAEETLTSQDIGSMSVQYMSETGSKSVHLVLDKYPLGNVIYKLRKYTSNCDRVFIDYSEIDYRKSEDEDKVNEYFSDTFDVKHSRNLYELVRKGLESLDGVESEETEEESTGDE